jgi:hypothetical protein
MKFNFKIEEENLKIVMDSPERDFVLKDGKF